MPDILPDIEEVYVDITQGQGIYLLKSLNISRLYIQYISLHYDEAYMQNIHPISCHGSILYIYI